MREARQRLIFGWLLLALVLLNVTGIAVARDVALPLVLLDQQSYDLDSGELSVLKDPNHALTLEQVRAAKEQGRFTPLQANLSAGYVPDTFWLYWVVERPQESPSAWWIEVLPSYLDQMELFHIDPRGHIDKRRGGDFLPQSAKEEAYRGNVFKFDLVPGEHQFYLRLRTTSTMVATVTMWQPKAFIEHLRDSYLIFGLCFSIIVTVMVFNAVSALISRRLIFAAYAGYLAFNGILWLAISGLLSEYLFPEQPRLANLTLGISVSLSYAMAFVFFSMLFELHKYHRWIYRLNVLGVIISVLTAIATPLGLYQQFAPLLLAISVVSIACCPWPLHRLWKSGYLWNRLVVVAYANFAVLMIINILGTMALIPYSNFIVYCGMLSNLFHIMTLHFAILLHYRDIEKAHEVAVQEALIAHKQYEEQKNHREELDKLLAMIAHEIRTPIALIDLATQNLLDVENDRLESDVRAEPYLRYERIRRAVQRLATLVDLTDNGLKFIDNTWQLKLQTVDPKELTLKAIDLLEPEKAKRVDLQVNPGLPLIQCDVAMLQFVLLNLIDNACKYSPANTRVRVIVEVSGDLDGAQVLWHVQDQGPGIAQGMHNKVFEKYVRGNEINNVAGLGLGLYLSRHIIKRHGGDIRLINSESGAHFICRLPVYGG